MASFFNPFTISKFFFPYHPQAAHFSSSTFADRRQILPVGAKILPISNSSFVAKSFRQIPLPPAATPDQDAHIALLCAGPRGRAFLHFVEGMAGIDEKLAKCAAGHGPVHLSGRVQHAIFSRKDTHPKAACPRHGRGKSQGMPAFWGIDLITAIAASEKDYVAWLSGF